MARDYSGEAEIIGVPSRDTEAAATAFVERHGLSHVRHAYDAEGQVWAAFSIVGQPAWVFVDGATGEASVTFGALTPEQLTVRLGDLEAGPG